MTNSRSSLEALLARVEAAEGANDELSAQVLSALLSEEPVVAVERSPINGVWCAYVMGHGGRRRLWDVPSPFRQMNGVTASLDAALALVERVLPEADVYVHATKLRKPKAVIFPTEFANPVDSQPSATSALALLAALLKALIAQEGAAA